MQLQNTYRAYRLATHRLALDNKPPLVSSAKFIGEREFVIAVWRREMREKPKC
jgi:hypothetical protein